MMKTKTRVAFFADMLIPDMDGACRTMFEIINRIPSDAFEFLFITGQAEDGAIDHHVIEMPTLTLPMNDTYKMALPLWATGAILSGLQKFQPDIIHIATPSILGKFAQDYAVKNEIPVISIYHTHFVSYIDYYLKKYPSLIEPTRKWVTDRHRKFYNRCHKVLVPCEVIREELSRYGFREEVMEIWPRGINLELFDRKKYSNGYLKSITKNNYPNILFASRLVWEKNLDTLVAIYNSCQDRSYNFIIAGEGAASSELREKMPKAFFLGKLNHQELARCYAAADVFLFPSVSETYGNVVAEALASGLPCVIGHGGGSINFIEEGINGFLCDPFDPISYRDKLDFILSDSELEIAMSAAARQSVDGLSWGDLADRYFDSVDALTQPSYALTA